MPAGQKDSPLVVEISPGATVGMLARKVAACPTPHAKRAPPRVSVLLAVHKPKQKLAVKTLERLKGVETAGIIDPQYIIDPTHIIDPQYIVAKLAPNGRVTVERLLGALEGAGIGATIALLKAAKP